jgi:tripartite-type tricarboxylate transporter receptor subunit TctC
LKHRTFLKLALAGLASLAGLNTAYAQQSYPSRPISIVVPYSPGGTVDALARRLGEALRKQINATVVIENKPGAGASLGADFVSKSAPDGHTILIASTSPLTIFPHITKTAYKPLEDLAPIASVAISPAALVATKASNAKNFQDLLAAAKARPDSVRYGTPGVGTIAHLAMEVLSDKTGTRMLHIPYKGNTQALTDAIGGSFELLVANVDVLLPHVQSATFRPLAVMAPKRLEAWPNVPTMAELGHPEAQYYSNFGMFVPAKTPAAVLNILKTEIRKAISTPEYAEFLAKSSMQPGFGTGPEFARQIKAEYELNGKVIKAAQIKYE